MKILALVAAAATATTLLLSPASAQNGSWDNGYRNNWNSGWSNEGWRNNWNGNWQRQGWNQGWNNDHRGWNSRDVGGHFRPGDPSYNSNARFRASPNRCTEDLGYGRYEYCGW